MLFRSAPGCLSTIFPPRNYKCSKLFKLQNRASLILILDLNKWLEYFQALRSGRSPIRIYPSLTSCWHTLNESHKIFVRHGIPCLFYSVAKTILNLLLSATQIRMTTLDVILHLIPNTFYRVKIRRVGRPENWLN